MKRWSKFVSMMVVMAMLATVAVLPAYAEEVEKSESIYDIYAQEMTEVVDIEGDQFVYRYFYDSKGYRNITIQEVGTNIVDTVVYDDDKGEIYLNDKMFGTVTTRKVGSLTDLNSKEAQAFASSSWVFLNSYVKQVSWEEGTTVAIIAAAIAVALAFTGAGAIISMVEATLLYSLALHARGGSVSNSIYKLPLATDFTLKEVWSVTSQNGVKIGPYTSYTPT